MATVLEGSWWLPSSSTNEVAGRLEYTPGELGTLTYFGSIDEDASPYVSPKRFGTVGERERDPIARIVFGEAFGADGQWKRVTLFGLLNSSHNIAFLNNSDAAGGHIRNTTRLSVSGVLIGAHLGSSETPVFDTLSVQLAGLGQWLRETPIQDAMEFEANSLQTMSINYVRPKLPTARLRGVDATLSFDTALNVAAGPESHSMNYAPSFQVQFARPSSLDELRKVAGSLHSFLCIATGWPTAMRRLYGVIGMASESPTVVDVSYAANLPWNLELDTLSVDFLTSLQTVGSGERLEDLLNAWLVMCDTAPGPIARLLDSLYRHHTQGIQYQDVELIHLVQAAEGIHRRWHRGTHLSKADYKRARKVFEKRTSGPDGIFRDLPEEFKAATMRSLSMANEYSLRDRLHKLVAEVGSAGASFIRDTDAFVKEVVSARNDITHDLSQKGKRADGTELLRLNLQLRCLIISYFLVKMGFTCEELEVGFTSYRVVRSLAYLDAASSSDSNKAGHH